MIDIPPEVRALANGEEVRPIPSYPGYFVTSYGKIISTRNQLAIVLKQQPRKYGYRSVTLYGKHKQLVHRLVASAFIGEPPSPEHEIRHKDDNPSNNHVDNLVWGTHSENMGDMVAHGRSAKGSTHGQSKLIEKDIMLIHQRLANGENCAEIARSLGVSSSAIRHIKNGKRWVHLCSDIPQEKIIEAQKRVRAGEKNNSAKLTNQQVQQVRECLASGEKVVHIARMFGVANTTISDIKHGKTWR